MKKTRDEPFSDAIWLLLPAASAISASENFTALTQATAGVSASVSSRFVKAAVIINNRILHLSVQKGMLTQINSIQTPNYYKKYNYNYNYRYRYK